MTGLVVRKVLEKVLPDRHSENRQPASAEAVKEKVSPGLAEARVSQSPGLDDGVQVWSGDPVCVITTEPCPLMTTSMPDDTMASDCAIAELPNNSRLANKGHLRTRNKIKISYRIAGAFDGFELHVQRTGVQLIANGEK